MSQQILCTECSAPLDVRQGDAVAYCTYCNHVNQLRSVKESEEHFMLDVQIDREHIRAQLLGDLLKIPGISENFKQELQIIEARLVYTPYYVTQVHGNLRWSGLGRQASYHRPYKGAYRNISFHTVPESGVFDDQISVTSYAGSEKDNDLITYKIAPVGRKYMSRGEIDKEGGVVDDEQFDFKQAELTAVKHLENKHNALLREELDSVHEAIPYYTIGQNQLFHVPIWHLKWKPKGGKEYTAKIDASNGITIYTDTPRSKSYLLMVLLIGIFYTIIGAIPYLLFGGDYATLMIYSSLILGLFFAVQTIYLNRPKQFKEKDI